MIIDKTIAKYVADLSRLKISEDEIDFVCKDLSSILEYMDEINSTIDTDYVKNFISGSTNVMREDQVVASMDRGELLKNAPEHTEETPIVPKTVD